MSDLLFNDLTVLGLNDIDISELSVKLVKTSFFKLALVKHPDKTGGSKTAFQELLNAYQNILKHISENLNHENRDSDEQFLTL